MLRHLLGFLMEEVLQSLRLVQHVLVVQPAQRHSRGELRTELLVPDRQLRVVPPQLLQRRQLLLVVLVYF